MYIELTGLTLNANPGIKIDTEGFMQVTSLALGADFEGIVLHLDNLLGGGDFGETINNLLSVLGPQIWDLVSLQWPKSKFSLILKYFQFWPDLMVNFKKHCRNWKFWSSSERPKPKFRPKFRPNSAEIVRPNLSVNPPKRRNGQKRRFFVFLAIILHFFFFCNFCQYVIFDDFNYVLRNNQIAWFTVMLQLQNTVCAL